VVNLIVDKTYTGFKANMVFSNDSHDDQKKYKVEATWAPTSWAAGLTPNSRPTTL